jgi:two-component system sporulation sensor kinase A
MLTLRTGESQFNVVMGVYKSDDTLSWILINAQPLFNEVQEKPYAVVVTFADITDRKQMEDALRESEAKYRLIAENTSDGILMLDGRSGTITYASPSYDRQHGRAIGETVQMSSEAIRAAIHPDDREWVLQMTHQGIENRLSDLSYVFRSLHKDGHYFWCEDYNHMNYAPDGTYLFSNIISRDVTERKELEATLETRRAEILTQFIRDSAHEFRTPLSIIGSSAYLLTRLTDPDQRQHKATQINEQIKRMTHLLEMLTLMVRLENREEMTEQVMSINEVLQESAIQIIDIYGAKRVFRYEVPDDLPTLMGNSDLLTEAFRQILENAYRFTPPGGSIILTAGAANRQVWVEVVDTGRGIAPENLPNIFKTFWRQDDSHTTAGFGLGLTIVNRIIQRHGGTIIVQSEVGQGTRVRVTLPAAPA